MTRTKLFSDGVTLHICDDVTLASVVTDKNTVGDRKMTIAQVVKARRDNMRSEMKNGAHIFAFRSSRGPMVTVAYTIGGTIF